MALVAHCPLPATQLHLIGRIILERLPESEQEAPTRACQAATAALLAALARWPFECLVEQHELLRAISRHAAKAEPRVWDAYLRRLGGLALLH